MTCSPVSANSALMGCRPVSGNALSRRWRDGGTRVQFRAGLDETGPHVKLGLSLRPSRPVPVDPLPDSDDEPELTLTPHAADHLDGSARAGAAKWWHVADTQIEELVHTIEDTTIINSPSRRLLRGASTQSPSATCRAMVNAGQKSSATVNACPWDGSHMDKISTGRPPADLSTCPVDITGGHAAADAFAASSTLLRDLSVRDTISKGMSWTLEGRQPFNNWTSPKRRETGPSNTEQELLLSATGVPSLSNFSGIFERPSTAPEQTKAGCSSLGSSPSATASRPSSACADNRAKHKGRATVTHLSKLSRSATIPCTSSGHRHSGIVDDRELIQVELTFYDNSDSIMVLLHPDAQVGPCPGTKDAEKKDTLKGMISKLTGIASCSQRLKCRGFDVSADKMTLREAGISHGCNVTVHTKKAPRQNKGIPVLACTAKRLEQQQKNLQQDSRRAACLKASRKEKQGTVMMPKWSWGIPPDNTKFGRGYNDVGGKSSFKFENQHIWYYPAMTGLNSDADEYRLMEVRSHQTYAEPVGFASDGVSLHCT